MDSKYGYRLSLDIAACFIFSIMVLYIAFCFLSWDFFCKSLEESPIQSKMKNNGLLSLGDAKGREEKLLNRKSNDID